MAKSTVETEVKIRAQDLAAIRERLEVLHFEISEPRQLEINILYDDARQSLREREMLLRLRQFGNASILTWKGPGEPGPHKSRPELETTVGSRESFDKILQQLGFHPVFRYDKYRTEFSPLPTHNAEISDQAGVVTVDETPIGNFLEIEGPPAWIDSTAASLGFSPHDYVLASYGRLYLDFCRERNVQPSNMVFASQT